MSHNAFQHNIPMLRSLFKGREDVFAVRWEKGNRSGYMPAYQYDPHHYRMHKINGGTFQNYNHKNYLPLTEKEIKKHLAGGQQIGIYPLLADNTSWFLVADFDKQNWKDEAVTFLTACNEKGIPAYLERSRSGNGAHVWIFFQKPYPAVKSRNIFTSILQQCGLTSIFDKNSSFDRLFPNQDFHSGKGLGNLIALPFFGPAVESGNSCFINPESFVSFPDQWAFLHKIEKISTDELDSMQLEASNKSGTPIPLSHKRRALFSLHQNIRIRRDGLTTPLINFLKEELNFANTEFFVKKKARKSTFGTEKYFKLLEEAENEVVLPRGFIGRLLRFCKEKNIDYEFEDERQKREAVHFSFNATLRSHQEQAILSVVKKDFGIVVAPPGSGKTVMGLKIIADKQQPALIIVHRKQLLEQWSERIQSFLGIPKNEVGIIGQGKAKIGGKITIGTIQSLPKQIDNIQNRFGIILVDECHHIPAKTFRTTIGELESYYLYGLTATPFRKYSDDKMILAYLGDIIADIPITQVEHYKHAQIIVRNTSLDVPFNSKTDKFETLSQILIHDSARNKLIVDDIKKELSKGIRIAIITERKEHIDTLYLFLKQVCEVITLSGDDTDNIRKRKWQALNDGHFQALITTGQYFGEGSDLSNISALFLVYPFSFKGKLIQYLGRVQRSETNPTIYDYRDLKIDYLNKLFLKRNTYYRQIAKQRSLFDEPTDFTPPKQNTIIAKQIKVSIGDLDFRYGNVGFEYIDKERNERLEFEIENEEIRPEFEVLKAYFIKILGSNHVVIDIHAELKNGVILSQLATSQDIVNINKEIIESVKFEFLSKSFIGQIPKAERNILTADELPVDQKLYENTEQILTDLLRSKSYKHARHILFLANKHERTIMKLRFVLQPFSFVFLLKGDQNYHIILETLDTEEATYIWHTDNNRKSLLIETVKKIDQELSIIRKKGRQAYLETDPQNFSKIVHDYTDNEKGFITWISQLEERLT